MIARRDLPKSFSDWNKKWGAPYGRLSRLPKALRWSRYGVRRAGPFANQCNSSLRTFEYPWVYQQISALGARLTVVDVGGGLAGMQFVLAREGHKVVNVDPGQAELGWKYARETHERLCHVFSAPVALHEGTLGTLAWPAGSVDVVYSISALEHFTEPAVNEVLEHSERLLRPNGRLVLTVDLFLDVAPFGRRRENRWGRNQDLRAVLGRPGFSLVEGVPDELFGFAEFEPSRILENLEHYLIGDYPALAQCLVLEKQY